MTGADAGRRGCGGLEWWSALPDLESATPAAVLLSGAGDLLARHDSGRPWIIGHQSRCPVRKVELRSVRVVVFGECLASDARLVGAAGGDLVRLLALPGSFHTVLTGPAGVMAAGDVAAFRRVFATRVAGVPVVASRADVLRRIIGAPVNRMWLAARLTSPDMPSVLRERLSPFVGIDPIPPGCWVEIARRSWRVRRWWTPPAPDCQVGEGADTLRETLTAAVATRIDRAGPPVSVQLSGGLDSTTLAWLAAAARPLLLTTAGRSPVDEDHRYARRVAEHLPDSAHRVVDWTEAPEFFADLEAPLPGMDEPVPFTAGAARARYTARLLAESGVTLHLNGQGGDEVLLAPLAYLRAAIRTDPHTGWRHLRGHAALKNTPLWTMALAVLRNDSFAAWLARCAATLATERSPAIAATGWEAPPLLAPWASPEAAELVSSAIRSAEPSPLAGDQATHAALARIRASAYRAALYRDFLQNSGVLAAMPFFDRTVIEACLATCPWQRTSPWQPKPLLRAAFAGHIPDQLLARRTKGHYNADIHHGWFIHREQITELLHRPLLAEWYGLIDPTAVRRALAGFGPSGLPPAWLTELVAVERWLRDLSPPSPRPVLITPAAPVTPSRCSAVMITLARHVSTAAVDDGMTLIDGRRGTVYHLNPTGAAILADLTAGGLEHAVTRLITDYDITEEHARADVAALVDDLRRRGLVTMP